MINRFISAIVHFAKGVFVQRRQRVIGELLEFSRLYSSRARVSSGVTLEGSDGGREKRDGTREEEADLTIRWWEEKGERRWCARPLHCGGVGLQLDGAVSLTCLRNPPALRVPGTYGRIHDAKGYRYLRVHRALNKPCCRRTTEEATHSRC